MAKRDAIEVEGTVIEPIPNAMFAIEDEFDDRVSEGRIDISVSHLSDPAKITIEVADDGIGLDQERYGAFCTIDTDFKRSKGGKGVGRLFWLDAFDGITIESGYRDATEFKPIRDAVAHTAILTDQAKARLTTVRENIKGRVKKLLSKNK